MSQQNVIHTLSEVPILSTCSRTQLTDLASRMLRRRYNKGDFLMREGEKGNKFFIIVQGRCIVKTLNKHTNQIVIIAELSIGDYCGEQALMSANQTRNASIEAGCEVVALVVDRETFKNIMIHDIGIGFAKRKAICAEDMSIALSEMHSNSNKSSATIESKFVESFAKMDLSKTPTEKKWIWYTVSGNVLFAHLTPDQKSAVIEFMYKKKINVGDHLIKEGDEGNNFYVVAKGKFEVSNSTEGVIKLIGSGDCVGELALLYNAKRSASVRCTSDGYVWCLHRMHLRQVIKEESQKVSQENIGFLKKVPILSSLLNSEIVKLDSVLEEEAFSKNDIIIKQGDDGDKFYIIKEGSAKVLKKDKNSNSSTENKCGVLSAGAYFGERALIKNEKRAATIVVSSDQLICLTCNRETFTLMLGNLDVLMKRNMVQYENDLRMLSEDRRKRSLEKRQSINVTDDLSRLKIIGLLGRGGYGLVKLVKDPTSRKAFALKEVRKDKVLEGQQTTHINNERSLMMQMHSPFLVHLWRTYQDKYKVYFLLDVCMGGDLFTVLRKSHSFKETAAKFYAGCVILGFEHLHSMNMLYRDLKPENLVLDSDGYCKITDFGFCKVVNDGKTYTLCGTPDYLAPEIIMGKGHGKGVDYWTLGVLIYEMLGSMPPFYDRDPTNIYRKIIRTQPRFPGYFSKQAKSIIRKLLTKKAHERLGNNAMGIKGIKTHEWFLGFDWEGLSNQSMRVPYKPKISSDEDLSHFKCAKVKEAPFKTIKNQSAFRLF